MILQRRLRLVNREHEQSVTNTEDSIYIAFATSDMKHVNQHFGAAKCFAIYALDQQSIRFVEVAQFAQHRQDGNDDKLAAKMRMVQGCAAVYCQAVGSSAIKRLLRAGIQPVKVELNTPIAFILKDLKSPHNHASTRWLSRMKRQMQTPDPGRFEKMEREGWSE